MQKKLPETITWKALSHEHHHRSSGWYLMLGIVSLGLIGFGIYNHSILTVLTFILIILVVLILSAQRPRLLTYKASQTGISVGNTHYPYKIIKTFWIVYDPPQTKTLNFETTAYLNNRVSLQLADQNPVELKLFLSEYLPEDLDHEDSITETLAKNLKI